MQPEAFAGGAHLPWLELCTCARQPVASLSWLWQWCRRPDSVAEGTGICFWAEYRTTLKHGAGQAMRSMPGLHMKRAYTNCAGWWPVEPLERYATRYQQEQQSMTPRCGALDGCVL